MNTIQCPECGRQVRTDLAVCPNCGAVLKASDPLLKKKILYVVSIIMIISGIVFGIIKIIRHLY